ncbi:MAG: signal peptidase I [Mediterranea sp.]|jgi:signal peptidase I|nr:signal peptidase I [Mediterranea sp.]
MKNNLLKKGWGILLNTIIGICMVVALLFLLQLFCYTSFKIPTDSMTPTLLVGDRILVNKMTLGARLFDVVAALKGEQVRIRRMPALGHLERNDVIVFNFPYGKSRWDSVRMDVTQYYVKRCVALPGDTLEIKDGSYQVRGYAGPLGNPHSEQIISSLTEDDAKRSGISTRTYPFSERLGWDIWNFGPLPVPKAGQVVRMDSVTYLLYRPLIAWEQRRKLCLADGAVLLGDSVIAQYRFLKNYYFVSGDQALNSQDSRYWGLLPEEYIVGKVVRVWYSEDKWSGEARWNRWMKRVE